MQPDVSIIIVSYQSRALVRECLKSIYSLSSMLHYEVLVVDSEGDAKLAEMLEMRFPEVVYLKMPKNLGLAVANNAGARLSRGRTLLFLNPDITMREGAIETLLSSLESTPDTGMVAPQLLNPDMSVQQSYFRFYTPFTILCRRTKIGATRWGKRHLNYILMTHKSLGDVNTIDWCIAACFAMRREVWDRLGGMDERFFLYFEDMDLAKRIKNMGYTVKYVSAAKIVHLYGHSSAGPMNIRTLLNPLTRIHIGSGIKYFIKHAPWRHAQPISATQ